MLPGCHAVHAHVHVLHRIDIATTCMYFARCDTAAHDGSIMIAKAPCCHERSCCHASNAVRKRAT